MYSIYHNITYLKPFQVKQYYFFSKLSHVQFSIIKNTCIYVCMYISF